MTICKRVIARLDVKGSKLIKGKRYEGLRVIGDACEAAKKYASQNIDEIFYSDAVASLYERNGLSEILRKSCQDVFIPITVGGAIRTVEDGRRLLAAGADKLAINTAALKNPQLINELANTFGKQCVIVSIQARKSLLSNEWDIMVQSGRDRASKKLIDWIKEIQERGAGEIFLGSVDQDGTGKGADLELIKKVSPHVQIPLVVGGGINSKENIQDILNIDRKISGFAIGSEFHKNNLSVNEVKGIIKNNSFPVRKLTLNKNIKLKKNINIAIVDYSMGNVESLRNGLKNIGANVILTSDDDLIQKADIVALPGVGSFPEGMRQLKEKNLIDSLKNKILNGGSLIGICLGMQLLFDESNEYVKCKGLGFIEGNIEKLPNKTKVGKPIILPNVGWNKLTLSKSNKNWFGNLEDNFYQYFVHSYGAIKGKINPKYGLTESLHGDCKYFSAVKKNKVIGLQFHPERSGADGLELLVKIIEKLSE